MDWPYHYTPYVWPLLATTAFIWLLGLYGWRRRSVPGAVYFVLLQFLGGLWALFSALQLSSSDFAVKFFWWRLEVSTMALAVTANFCFVVAYAGLGKWLTRRNLALLALPPLALILLTCTNELHHWMWTEVVPGDYLRVVFGPGIWSFLAFYFLLYFVPMGVLLWLFVRSPLFRWPVALILVGQQPQRIVFFLGAFGLALRWPFDPLVLTFNVAAIAYALALFRFRIFNVVPLARESVVERMNDGMLVVDAIGRIADLNPAAQDLLNAPRSETIGQAARQALGAYPPLQRLLDDPSLTRTEIQAGADSRWYAAHLSPLLDPRGFRLGQLLLLHDVTDQKRAQAQLLEQQRVVATLQERQRLARELHDSVGQVLGYVSMQAQAIRQWVHDGEAALAEAQLARLANVAQDAHADIRASILSLKAGSAPEWSFLAALRQQLVSFSDHYGISAELTIPPDLDVAQAFEPGVGVQLLRVIQEAMTNARKHGRAGCVQVAFELRDGEVRIIVADDGRGFDADQLASGASQGDHFGLAFMRERMAHIGGCLTVHSRPGAGAQVVLQVPIRDE
jgi:PAS domain S-box-containing protein